jgi:hypothetical protein
MPTFVGRGMSRGQRSITPRPLNLVFYAGALTFSFKWLLSYSRELSGSRFQNIWYSRESDLGLLDL